MAKVLFICGDNVGRSQVAEALFNKHAKKSVAESCAGKPEVKERRMLADVPNENVVDVIEIMKSDYGVDISSSISKPFSLDMVKKADKVITLCSENECPAISGAEHWGIRRFSLLDMEGKRKEIVLLDEKVKALLKRIDEQ